MATTAQITANLLNAQKSTGPITDAGKEKSATNATTHGLTARAISLRCQAEQARFDAFTARLLPGLAPQTDVESEFAQLVIAAMWRIQRLAEVEESMFLISANTANSTPYDATGTKRNFGDACGFGSASRSFSVLSLYEQRLTRMMHKNLEILRKLQQERRAEAAKAAKQPVQRTTQPVETTEPQPEIGFVFPTPEPAPASPPETAQAHRAEGSVVRDSNKTALRNLAA